MCSFFFHQLNTYLPLTTPGTYKNNPENNRFILIKFTHWLMEWIVLEIVNSYNDKHLCWSLPYTQVDVCISVILSPIKVYKYFLKKRQTPYNKSNQFLAVLVTVKIKGFLFFFLWSFEQSLIKKLQWQINCVQMISE